MDFALQTALTSTLTAAVIASLILASQKLGEHVAGMLAGLPFTTVPALFIVGAEHGRAAAAELAAGGIVGCALAALFAVAYHHASRRLGPIATLFTGLAALAAGVSLACGVRLGAGPAVLLAFSACLLARASVKEQPALRSAAQPGQAPRTPTRATLSALATGAVSAGVAAAVGGLSPVLAGIVATMPMIGVVTVSIHHTTIGRAAVTPYLRGYIESSMCKAAFCAIFACCAVPLGVTLAMAGALTLSLGALIWSSAPRRASRA